MPVFEQGIKRNQPLSVLKPAQRAGLRRILLLRNGMAKVSQLPVGLPRVHRAQDSGKTQKGYRVGVVERDTGGVVERDTGYGG